MILNSEFPFSFLDDMGAQFGDLPFTEWEEEPKPKTDDHPELDVSEG